MSVKKLLFIYDNLMTHQEQKLAGINLQFVSFAIMYGKLHWITDGKKKRYFAMPTTGRSTRLVYGGLFILNDYDEQKLKLHAYYNNSLQYTNQTLPSDLFDCCNVQVSPIKFDSLKSIEKNTYVIGDSIDSSCFIGNSLNKRICFNIKRSTYYKVNSVVKDCFVTMIKENVNG